MKSKQRPQLATSTLRHLLVELVLKAKSTDNPEALDTLLSEALPKLQACIRYADQLITEHDVAALYPRLFDVVKLRNLRSRGGGPTFIKFGTSRNARVFYRIRAIEDWIQEHEGIGPDAHLSFAKCA